LIGCKSAPDHGLEGSVLGTRFAKEDGIVFSDALGGNALQANGAYAFRGAQQHGLFDVGA
jgi:hypothetical protein